MSITKTIRCDGEDEIGNQCEETSVKTEQVNNLIIEGWLVVRHRHPDDHVVIVTKHYCPDCRGNVYDGP